MKKQEEIKTQILKTGGDYCYEMEKRYKRKMEENEKQKKILDKEKENKIREMNLEIQAKSIKTEHIRNLIEQEIITKNNLTMYKIENFYYKSQKKKEHSERDLMRSSENLVKKKMNADLKNKINDKLREMERQRAMETIKENNAKAENFLETKNYLSQQKKILSIELSNDRQKKLEELEILMRKYKEITVK